MPKTNLPRATKLVAALCTALALSTPAFALDVQIQEGAAVKFPKGLKWETMVKTQKRFPGGQFTSFPAEPSPQKEHSLVFSVWKKELSLPESNITKYDKLPWKFISKLIKLNNTFYFITSAQGTVGYCDDYTEKSGENIQHCKAKIVASHDAKFTSPVTIDAGTICVKSGDEYSHDGDPDDYYISHPEIAFDSHNNTIYVRQYQYGDEKFAQSCNRKITLVP